MSEQTRQRRLHVENRLAELRAKHGREDELLEWGEPYFTRLKPDNRTNRTPIRDAKSDVRFIRIDL